MSAALGALAGGLLGGGALLVGAAVARRRPPAPVDRIAPYVAGAGVRAVRRDELGARVDATTVGRLLVPLLLPVVRRLPRSAVSDDALAARLAASGSTSSPERFRLEQLLWGLGGVGAVVVVLTLAAASGRVVRGGAALLLLVLAGALGALLRDRALTKAVARRREAIAAGLPVVADLLALAVGSGESPAAALARVARVAHGPLADECARATRDASSGRGLVDALEAMSARVDVPAVRRFVDGVAIAVQRGTPLADVLRAQAADARAEQHRALLEVAGRKELLMLVPVVFLVLPTVVLVALYPALTSLAVLGS
ncbi:MAG: type II secretion system F family protein [Candidatus Nanopelagicales bacterium]